MNEDCQIYQVKNKMFYIYSLKCWVYEIKTIKFIISSICCFCHWKLNFTYTKMLEAVVSRQNNIFFGGPYDGVIVDYTKLARDITLTVVRSYHLLSYISTQ